MDSHLYNQIHWTLAVFLVPMFVIFLIEFGISKRSDEDRWARRFSITTWILFLLIVERLLAWIWFGL